MGPRDNGAVRDRESEMREHLQAQFPVYSQSMLFEKLLSDVRLGGG